MRVSNLLATKGRDVATISQERTVSDALQVLKERSIGALVVTGPTPPLVGHLQRARRGARPRRRAARRALQAKVADLMSSDVTTCDETTTVIDLMGLMTERRIRHVPVVVEGQLVGLVSIGDVVKARFDELEHEKKDLLDYVSVAGSRSLRRGAKPQLGALEGRLRQQVRRVSCCSSARLGGDLPPRRLLGDLGARHVDLAGLLGDAGEHRGEGHALDLARTDLEVAAVHREGDARPRRGLDAHDARHEVADRGGVLGQDRELAVGGTRDQGRGLADPQRRLGRHDLDLQGGHVSPSASSAALRSTSDAPPTLKKACSG